MPAAERVISNTSPLCNLALIDRLDYVERQFSGVEVLSARLGRPVDRVFGGANRWLGLLRGVPVP